MTVLIIGILVGILLAWLYRRVGRYLLGEDKWRQRAIRNFNHDDFLKLHDSIIQEYVRRYGGKIYDTGA